MFNHHDHFEEGFSIANVLTPHQLECYTARAKIHKQRFPWSEALDPVWRVCLVHTSANVPGKIAYYQSIENLVNNRLTRTSPEMFLDRFLTHAPEKIRLAWKVEVLGTILPTVQFISNTDPEGWMRVYKLGPHSCMRGDPLVKAYAHPNSKLALAYAEDSSGNIWARSIVNTKTKTYIRVYSGQDAPLFVAALNKAGYWQDDNTLEGQPIYTRQVECETCSATRYLTPYFDGGFDCINVPDYHKEEGIITRKGCEETTDNEYFNCCE